MWLPHWDYRGADPGLKLFTLANPLLPPSVERPTVLEIGAHDTPFVELLRAQGCDSVGLDWREGCDIQADVLTWDGPPEPVDVIVSLSAIEHIGLGRYVQQARAKPGKKGPDPIDPRGDITAIDRAWDWLRPGGFFYFDVPYTPEGYQLFQANKCRCYSDQALLERFGPHQVLGYTDLTVSGWIDQPAQNNRVDARPFYYVALLITKD